MSRLYFSSQCAKKVARVFYQTRHGNVILRCLLVIHMRSLTGPVFFVEPLEPEHESCTLEGVTRYQGTREVSITRLTHPKCCFQLANFYSICQSSTSRCYQNDSQCCCGELRGNLGVFPLHWIQCHRFQHRAVVANIHNKPGAFSIVCPCSKHLLIYNWFRNEAKIGCIRLWAHIACG